MSDPTRFDLDDRQRAMLAEMGVRVWWPQRTDETANAGPSAASPASAEGVAGGVASTSASAAISASAPSSVSPAQPIGLSASVTQAANPAPSAARPTRPGASPAAVKTTVGTAAEKAFQPLPEGIANMGWAALQEAVNACQACALCSARKAPVLGSGHASTTAPAPAPEPVAAPARWMVVGDLPSQEDDQQGQPFTGPEGQLLDNMLKAVGVQRQTPDSANQPVAYLTHALKCRPPGGRNPEAAEWTTCAAYLSRQVALVQPQVILVMGRFALQSLLGTAEPMGKLRGRVHDFQGVPVVVTYPLDVLLRNPAEKAKAWEDLVLALGIVKAH